MIDRQDQSIKACLNVSQISQIGLNRLPEGLKYKLLNKRMSNHSRAPKCHYCIDPTRRVPVEWEIINVCDVFEI